MSKEVKRWNAAEGGGCELAPTGDSGDYVESDAYDALLAERDRLQEDRDSQQRVCIAQMEKISQLRSEVAALKKDAERYRWLNNPANFHAAVSQQLWLLHGSQEFGERIDKAIGKGEQP